MNVYTCYDAAGNVMGEGTSRELWEAGVFGDDNGAYYAYNQQGGRCIKRGIAKMTCRKEVRQVSMHNTRSDKPPAPKGKRPKLPVLRKIKDPTPLDYDVHDLMTYNAIAKKRGPTGADLRLLGGGGKAGKAIKIQTGKPPMGNHRGVFDKKYKARWVLLRRLGGRHIGLYKSEPLSVPVGLWPRENAAPR